MGHEDPLTHILGLDLKRGLLVIRIRLLLPRLGALPVSRELEPGCLAMLYNCWNPDNNGKIVTCIRFVGGCPPVDNFTPPPRSTWWEVDTPIPMVRRNGQHTRTIPFSPTDSLLRIDGYDSTEDVEESKLETVK